MTVELEANGNPGKAGRSGDAGDRGVDDARSRTDRDGGHGQDGEPGEPGEAGPYMKVDIGLNDRTKEVVVSANAVSADGSRVILHPSQYRFVFSTLGEMEEIYCMVCGGDGGKGGNGGAGGQGGRGRDGEHATRRNEGTDGDFGGRGGNGGTGGNGGDGGAGGNIDVFVAMNATFLLMAIIKHCVAGGKGGEAGNHGKPGAGGVGGQGGQSHSYSKTKTSRGVFDDNVYIRTKHKEKAGGRRGRDGADGTAPDTTLVNGQNGVDGEFRIGVVGVGAKKETQYYEGRFDLAIVAATDSKISDMVSSGGHLPVYEFGETVIVQEVEVSNTGFMPTPTTRVMICVKEESSSKLTIHPEDCMFLPASAPIPANERGTTTQGFIRLVMDKPDLSALGCDFDPLEMKGKRFFHAFQLGPEKDTRRLQCTSDFHWEYPSFDQSGGEFLLSYPIKNHAGVAGLVGLSMGETTLMSLDLKNIGGSDLGSSSESKRKIYVQFALDGTDHDGGMIALEELTFRAKNNKGQFVDASVDPQSSNVGGFAGHVSKVQMVAANKGTEVEAMLTLSEYTQAFCRASMQVDCYLQAIPELGPEGERTASKEMVLIQRRRFVVSCQPPFEQNPAAQVVLVTSASTSSEQFLSWQGSLEKLGLEAEVYSLSLYGHLDPHSGIVLKPGGEKTETLRTLFAGKLVVVLNDEYAALPNQERNNQYHAAQFLTNLDEFEKSTRFLVVGGAPNSVKHLSTPAENKIGALLHHEGPSNDDDEEVRPTEESPTLRIQQLDSVQSYKERVKAELEHERKCGVGTSPSLQPGCDVIAVKVTTRAPNQARVKKIMEKQCGNVIQWLQKNDPIRNYAIEPVTLEKPKKSDDEGWVLGQLRVYRQFARSDNKAVLVTAPDNATSPEAIESNATVYALATALPINARINRFAALMDKGDDADTGALQSIADSLVVDFLWDRSNVYHAKMVGGKALTPGQVSPTLGALMASTELMQLVRDKSSDATVKATLSCLVAHLEGAADAKDLKPWWCGPWSRKRAVRKLLLAGVKALKEQWAAALDAQQQEQCRAELDAAIVSYVRTDRGKRFYSAKQRWSAGMAHVLSPRNSARYNTGGGMQVHRHSQMHAAAAAAMEEEEQNSGRDCHKMKKCVPSLVGPEAALEWRRARQSMTLLASRVHQAAVTDRATYLREEASAQSASA